MSMTCELEHVNITVIDADRTVALLTTVFPHRRVRGGGDMSGEGYVGRWLHLGTDEQYIAIQETSVAKKQARDAVYDTGFNHVGFVVDSVDDVLQKVRAEGYEGGMAESHPFRKRLYVTDHDGITWEFIEYLSDDPAQRNDYSQ